MTQREALQQQADQRQQVLDAFSHHLLVCAGLACLHNDEIIKALRKEIAAQGLEQQILVRKAGCMGLCALGPLVLVQPDAVYYQTVTPQDAGEIIAALGKEIRYLAMVLL